MIEWMLAPIDATRAHDVGPHLSWHARIMVVAWGGLVPIGILSARYFKIWPGQHWPAQVDNQNWWVIHRTCQYSAAVLMCVGLWMILNAPPLTIAPGPHALLGWSVLCLALVQVSSGLLRGTKGGPPPDAGAAPEPGDHYDMTVHRRIFEYVHKFIGYVALLLSVAAILTGLYQANAPRWMPLVLSIWWAILGIAFVTFQQRGMTVDTYAAIWGPDARHPGNRRRPIGIGVNRRGRERRE
ncbi:MAG: cytochrome b561 domain-containing protein [Pseudomonadota bacterium]